MIYNVFDGETINDVAYNTAGSIFAIDAIMEENLILTYTPQFTYGDTLNVTVEVQNNAAVLRANRFPYNSTLLPPNETTQLIQDVINKIEQNG